MLGLEKIEPLEKAVKEMQERIRNMDVEINVLRNEIRDLKAKKK